MKRCLRCGKEKTTLSFSELWSGESELCARCALPLNPQRFRFHGYWMETLYAYSDLQEMMLQYKRGDVLLANVFLEPCLLRLRWRYRHCHLIPVPSHPRQDEVRGFNPVREAFRGLRRPYHDILMKTKAQQQGGNPGTQRQNIAQIIRLKPGATLNSNTHYVLIDDVFTTGATLTACIQWLQRLGIQHLSILVLANQARPHHSK